jgi:hypothetical protein
MNYFIIVSKKKKIFSIYIYRMKDEHMLMYALVFVLGFMVSRMMGGRLIEGEEGRKERLW